MAETEVSRAAIERLVRHRLGCTCPDEVFDSIRIEQNPSAFTGLVEGTLLSIGGKLLVYLVATNDLATLSTKLEQIFRRGQETRDVKGYNRFRLVVSTPDVQRAKQMLLSKFNALEELDDRLHLHVIPPDQLPAL